MRHDVCTKQRVLDEFIEDLEDAMFELLSVSVGPPLTQEQRDQRYAQPIIIELQPVRRHITVSVIVER